MAATTTSSVHDTDFVLTTILFKTLSCQMLLMALRLKEGERQWESGREAKRVAEREPTDTVNKLSQTLF